MKERLTNNLGLKILSVVIAVFMWLIMVNVSNPLVSDSQEVTVDMINAEVLEKSNLTYEIIGKKTVTISYEVRIRDRYKISASDFYVYADLAEMYDVTGSVPVKIEVNDRNVKAMIEGTPVAKPGVVRVETEPLQKKRFYLTVNTIGQEEEGCGSESGVCICNRRGVCHWTDQLRWCRIECGRCKFRYGRNNSGLFL